MDFMPTFFQFSLWIFLLQPEFVLAALKLWKWITMQSYLEMTSMGFVVESSCLIFLLGICAVDTTTFYFEVGGHCYSLRVKMKKFDSWYKSFLWFILFPFQISACYYFSPTVLVKTYVEVVWSHAPFRRKHLVQKSLLKFFLENDVLVDDFATMERIL